MGYPIPGTPHPDLGWGTPHQQNGVPPPVWTWDEVPSIWTWDGVTPPPKSRPEMGYPHLASVNRLKLLPSVILRMRAVKIHPRTFTYLCELTANPINISEDSGPEGTSNNRERSPCATIFVLIYMDLCC